MYNSHGIVIVIFQFGSFPEPWEAAAHFGQALVGTTARVSINPEQMLATRAAERDEEDQHKEDDEHYAQNGHKV